MFIRARVNPKDSPKASICRQLVVVCNITYAWYIPLLNIGGKFTTKLRLPGSW